MTYPYPQFPHTDLTPVIRSVSLIREYPSGQSNEAFFRTDGNSATINKVILALSGNPVQIVNVDPTLQVAGYCFSSQPTYATDSTSPKFMLDPNGSGATLGNPATWADGSNLGIWLASAAKLSRMDANGVAIINRCMGEYDSRMVSADIAYYQPAELHLYDRLRTSEPNVTKDRFPVFASQSPFVENTTTAGLNGVRAARAGETAGASNNVHYGSKAFNDCIDRGDLSHMTALGDQNANGRTSVRELRWLWENGFCVAGVDLSWLQGLGAWINRWENVTGNPNQIRCYVVHDRGDDLVMPAAANFSPGAFSITDGANTIRVASAVYESPTSFLLNINGAHSIKLQVGAFTATTNFTLSNPFSSTPDGVISATSADGGNGLSIYVTKSNGQLRISYTKATGGTDTPSLFVDGKYVGHTGSNQVDGTYTSTFQAPYVGTPSSSAVLDSKSGNPFLGPNSEITCNWHLKTFPAFAQVIKQYVTNGFPLNGFEAPLPINTTLAPTREYVQLGNITGSNGQPILPITGSTSGSTPGSTSGATSGSTSGTTSAVAVQMIPNMPSPLYTGAQRISGSVNGTGSVQLCWRTSLGTPQQGDPDVVSATVTPLTDGSGGASFLATVTIDTPGTQSQLWGSYNQATFVVIAQGTPTDPSLPAPSPTTSGTTSGTTSSSSGAPIGPTKVVIPAGYQLQLSDTFAGPSLDGTIWSQNSKYTNQQSHPTHFDPKNVLVNNGLTIQAVQDTSYSSPAYSSSAIDTLLLGNNGFAFQYGLVIFKGVRCDPGTGINPNILLWPQNNKWPPEIDLLEDNTNNKQLLFTNMHWYDATKANNNAESDYWSAHDNTKAFELACLWTPDTLTFFVDGSVWRTLSNATTPVPQQLMFIGIQLFTGAYSQNIDGSTPARAVMQVRSVEVWQPPGAANTGQRVPISSATGSTSGTTSGTTSATTSGSTSGTTSGAVPSTSLLPWSNGTYAAKWGSGNRVGININRRRYANKNILVALNDFYGAANGGMMVRMVYPWGPNEGTSLGAAVKNGVLDPASYGEILPVANWCIARKVPFVLAATDFLGDGGDEFQTQGQTIIRHLQGLLPWIALQKFPNDLFAIEVCNELEYTTNVKDAAGNIIGYAPANATCNYGMQNCEKLIRQYLPDTPLARGGSYFCVYENIDGSLTGTAAILPPPDNNCWARFHLYDSRSASAWAIVAQNVTNYCLGLGYAGVVFEEAGMGTSYAGHAQGQMDPATVWGPNLAAIVQGMSPYQIPCITWAISDTSSATTREDFQINNSATYKVLPDVLAFINRSSLNVANGGLWRPPATVAPAAPVGTVAVPAGYALTFKDSFALNTFDPSVWTAPSYTDTQGPTQFLPANLGTGSGGLTLKAVYSGGAWTAASLLSQQSGTNGLSWQYGLFIFKGVSCKAGRGFSPNIALRAASQNRQPAVDILADGSDAKNSFQFIDHFYLSSAVNTDGTVKAVIANDDTTPSEIALLWDSTQLTLYVNGVQSAMISQNIPAEAMYLQLSMYLGSFGAAYPDSTTPSSGGTFTVKSVEVWQLPASAPPPLTSGTTSGTTSSPTSGTTSGTSTGSTSGTTTGTSGTTSGVTPVGPGQATDYTRYCFRPDTRYELLNAQFDYMTNVMDWRRSIGLTGQGGFQGFRWQSTVLNVSRSYGQVSNYDIEWDVCWRNIVQIKARPGDNTVLDIWTNASRTLIEIGQPFVFYIPDPATDGSVKQDLVFTTQGFGLPLKQKLFIVSASIETIPVFDANGLATKTTQKVHRYGLSIPGGAVPINVSWNNGQGIAAKSADVPILYAKHWNFFLNAAKDVRVQVRNAMNSGLKNVAANGGFFIYCTNQGQPTWRDWTREANEFGYALVQEIYGQELEWAAQELLTAPDLSRVMLELENEPTAKWTGPNSYGDWLKTWIYPFARSVAGPNLTIGVGYTAYKDVGQAQKYFDFVMPGDGNTCFCGHDYDTSNPFLGGGQRQFVGDTDGDLLASAITDIVTRCNFTTGGMTEFGINQPLGSDAATKMVRGRKNGWVLTGLNKQSLFLCRWALDFSYYAQADGITDDLTSNTRLLLMVGNFRIASAYAGQAISLSAPYPATIPAPAIPTSAGVNGLPLILNNPGGATLPVQATSITVGSPGTTREDTSGGGCTRSVDFSAPGFGYVYGAVFNAAGALTSASYTKVLLDSNGNGSAPFHFVRTGDYIQAQNVAPPGSPVITGSGNPITITAIPAPTKATSITLGGPGSVVADSSGGVSLQIPVYAIGFAAVSVRVMKADGTVETAYASVPLDANGVGSRIFRFANTGDYLYAVDNTTAPKINGQSTAIILVSPGRQAATFITVGAPGVQTLDSSGGVTLSIPVSAYGYASVQVEVVHVGGGIGSSFVTVALDVNGAGSAQLRFTSSGDYVLAQSSVSNPSVTGASQPITLVTAGGGTSGGTSGTTSGTAKPSSISISSLGNQTPAADGTFTEVVSFSALGLTSIVAQVMTAGGAVEDAFVPVSIDPTSGQGSASFSFAASGDYVLAQDVQTKPTVIGISQPIRFPSSTSGTTSGATSGTTSGAVAVGPKSTLIAIGALGTWTADSNGGYTLHVGFAAYGFATIYAQVNHSDGSVSTPYQPVTLDTAGNGSLILRFTTTGDYLVAQDLLTNPTITGVSSPITLLSTGAAAPVTSYITISDPGTQIVSTPSSGVDVSIKVQTGGLAVVYLAVFNSADAQLTTYLPIALDGLGVGALVLHLSETGDYIRAVDNPVLPTPGITARSNPVLISSQASTSGTTSGGTTAGPDPSVPANAFIPFAAGETANVLTDKQFVSAASSDLSTGFQLGTAKSAEVNKVLRQSSLMASVIAEILVQGLGLPVNDSQSVSQLATSLLLALYSSPTFTGTATTPTPPDGTGDQTVINAEFLLRVVAALAPINSPNFTGTPLAQTPSADAVQHEMVNAAWVNARLAAARGTTGALPVVYTGVLGTSFTATFVATAQGLYDITAYAAGGAGGTCLDINTAGGGGGQGAYGTLTLALNIGDTIHITIGAPGSRNTVLNRAGTAGAATVLAIQRQDPNTGAPLLTYWTLNGGLGGGPPNSPGTPSPGGLGGGFTMTGSAGAYTLDCYIGGDGTDGSFGGEVAGAGGGNGGRGGQAGGMDGRSIGSGGGGQYQSGATIQIGTGGGAGAVGRVKIRQAG